MAPRMTALWRLTAVSISLRCASHRCVLPSMSENKKVTVPVGKATGPLLLGAASLSGGMDPELPLRACGNLAIKTHLQPGIVLDARDASASFWQGEAFAYAADPDECASVLALVIRIGP